VFRLIFLLLAQSCSTRAFGKSVADEIACVLRNAYWGSDLKSLTIALVSCQSRKKLHADFSAAAVAVAANVEVYGLSVMSLTIAGGTCDS
jgi:hypothetical protein